jgi:hypothetical protein
MLYLIAQIIKAMISDLGKIQEERFRYNIKYFTRVFLETLRKTTNKVCRDSWYLGQDLMAAFWHIALFSLVEVDPTFQRCVLLSSSRFHL